MITIAQRRIDDVEASLCREWGGIRDPAAIASTLAAEHMRALIYGAMVDHRRPGVTPSIHTARLLASARRAVGHVWPQYGHRPPAPDICASTLDKMKAIGDAVDTGSGQWLATPLRIVAPKDGSNYLLAGAAPTRAAHGALGVLPTCVGTSRFVDAAVFAAKGHDDLVVSMDAWLGHHQALASWVAQLIAHHESHMETFEGLSAEQLELYAPDVIRTQHRTGRWISAGQIGRPLDGPRLCRPQDRYSRKWERPFYLAHFGYKDGVLTVRRATLVTPDLALRLRFGLDTMLQTSRRVSIVRRRETFWIDRPLTLPQPEARVYALGWNQASQDSADRLIFHANAMPFVLHALQRLAVTPDITGGAT